MLTLLYGGYGGYGSERQRMAAKRRHAKALLPMAREAARMKREEVKEALQSFKVVVTEREAGSENEIATHEVKGTMLGQRPTVLQLMKAIKKVAGHALDNQSLYFCKQRLDQHDTFKKVGIDVTLTSTCHVDLYIKSLMIMASLNNCIYRIPMSPNSTIMQLKQQVLSRVGELYGLTPQQISMRKGLVLSPNQRDIDALYPPIRNDLATLASLGIANNGAVTVYRD